MATNNPSDKASRPSDKSRDRKFTGAGGGQGKPTSHRKLNLLTATADDIMKVVNQVARERADTITRFVEWHLEEVDAGRQEPYSSVSEFLRDIPGFGPKLSRAFEAFTELDYDASKEEREAVEDELDKSDRPRATQNESA
jgi:hypothetical protein